MLACAKEREDTICENMSIDLLVCRVCFIVLLLLVLNLESIVDILYFLVEWAVVRFLALDTDDSL